MAKNTSPIQIADHLMFPININGLAGRKMVMPPRSKDHHDREFVFFYGHHASIERIYAFAEFLSHYGQVTIYDIPGLGGMDSFYSIGQKPTLETYADYMHTLFKTHPKKKETTVVGMSLTATILIRMLQKYPDMHDYFDLVVSFVGFADKHDFKFPAWALRTFEIATRFCSMRFPSWVVRVGLFNPISMQLLMWFFSVVNPKLKNISKESYKETIQMEKDLWRRNDMRTHFATYAMMFGLRYPKAEKVPINLLNLTTDDDQYFDGSRVEASLRSLFKDVTTDYLNLDVHVPSLIATEDDVAKIIPKSVVERELER